MAGRSKIVPTDKPDPSGYFLPEIPDPATSGVSPMYELLRMQGRLRDGRPYLSYSFRTGPYSALKTRRCSSCGQIVVLSPPKDFKPPPIHGTAFIYFDRTGLEQATPDELREKLRDATGNNFIFSLRGIPTITGFTVRQEQDALDRTIWAVTVTGREDAYHSMKRGGDHWEKC